LICLLIAASIFGEIDIVKPPKQGVAHFRVKSDGAKRSSVVASFLLI